jgi:pimeloyl-ACP methyl ester carboxylesterase
MTPPMGVGGFVWSSIIAPLSEHRRAYALDTIGDVGKSELADPARYSKTVVPDSAWLHDVFTALDVSAPDMVAGSIGGWIAMNHAIYAPERLRRLVLLAPMGLPPWRATLAVLGPFISQRLRLTEAKLDKIITRSLGEGERVNREFRGWMRIPIAAPRQVSYSAQKATCSGPSPVDGVIPTLLGSTWEIGEAIVVAVGLTSLAVFQVALIAGAPLGRAAWGGRYFCRVAPEGQEVGARDAGEGP